jgi:hypothetical protein
MPGSSPSPPAATGLRWVDRLAIRKIVRECQNSMHGRGPGVSLAELGSFSVFVDHVSEELMMPDRGVEQGHRGGAVGWWVVSRLGRLAVWR